MPRQIQYHRTPGEIATDRVFIARAYLERRTQREIAALLSAETGRAVGRGVVRLDVQALLREWRASRLSSMDAWVAEELAFLNHYERTCWEEWHRSRGDATETRVRSERRGGRTGFDGTEADPVPADGDGPQAERTGVRTATRLGDARYLAGVQWSHERRARILGLDGPPATRPAGATETIAEGGPQMSAADWDRAAGILEGLAGGEPRAPSADLGG